jgi:hypothetical protein
LTPEQIDAAAGCVVIVTAGFTVTVAGTLFTVHRLLLVATQ